MVDMSAYYHCLQFMIHMAQPTMLLDSPPGIADIHRGCSLDWGLSGYNTESLTVEWLLVAGAMLGGFLACQTLLLKIYEKRMHIAAGTKDLIFFLPYSTLHTFPVTAKSLPHFSLISTQFFSIVELALIMNMHEVTISRWRLI